MTLRACQAQRVMCRFYSAVFPMGPSWESRFRRVLDGTLRFSKCSKDKQHRGNPISTPFFLHSPSELGSAYPGLTQAPQR
jgi:hypothetical protein